MSSRRSPGPRDMAITEDMRTKFRALAEGGKVTMDLHDTGWGAVFGTLTDAHGVNWMFNHEKKTT